ncbi:hypothetical protein BCV70DRAFT_198417 [Testicularia cyperi]|uniref:DNA helicase n=1 Tax=Testicularia cyperi TaxID=1882483 RepID=A0A317XXR2_9BASI|nr:hypothetical protein BCV70DRAFT_198417 [Testicularia cyperi]
MATGYASDDSIEPATPPRAPAFNTPTASSSARIICLDSSPIVRTSPWKASSQPSRTSHASMTQQPSSFRSAMGGTSGSSSMTKTSFGASLNKSSSMPATSTNPAKRPQPSSSQSSSTTSSTSFKSSLERFRYGNGNGNGSTASSPTVLSDDSSGLSDPESSSDEANKDEPQPKKRKLVRGAGASRSRIHSDEDDDADRAQVVKTNATTIPSNSKLDKAPSPVQSQPSTTKSSIAPSATAVDAEFRQKVKRIAQLHRLTPVSEIISTLRRVDGNVQQALARLSSRTNGNVTTTTVSIKSTPSTIASGLKTNGVAVRSSGVTLQSRSSPQPSNSSRASSETPSTQARAEAKGRPVPTVSSKLANSTDAQEISSDEDDSDEHGRADKEEKAAVKWFNSADATALMDTTNCSAVQAEMIISLRPFRDADDIEAKLGSKDTKGVTPRLFHQCKDLMAGYYEVDEVLEKCENIGRELSSAMATWMPEAPGSTAPSSRFGSPGLPASSAAGSREGTPASTLNLSTVKKGGSVADRHYLEEQPNLLAKGVTLKDYQLVGVNWLSLLHRKRTSCILADEMGLGKTAQVISFLAHLKERGNRGPHLVVAPSSVLENWDREFRFFAPSVHVRKYYGSMKERVELREELMEDEDVEVVLTTYDMAAGGPQDHAFLRKFGRRGCGKAECGSRCNETGCRPGGFETCIFDEGHMLKNRKSQKYEKLLKIRTKWRLLLTGTPLQNNLQELVSLLNFIMPDYFADAEEALAAIFKVKPGAQQNQLSKQRVDRAKKMMHPFVLRRLKDKVLTDLTAKTIQVEYCDMTPVQRKIYNQVLTRTKRVADAASNADAAGSVSMSRSSSRQKSGGGPTATETGHVLMELRKAANHPLLTRRLFDEARIDAMARDLMKEPDYADYNFEHVKEDLRINTDAQISFSAGSYPSTRKHVLAAKEWMNSGKVQALERLIPEIQAKGDRILIFSQFTMVLDILCVCLENMGIKYVGFTGSTQVEDRQILVDQFTNDPSITVFLLSTKAGGLGINLIAANWVILFDQDFNPHNDKQAADRCYRMGQTKPVTVIKLLSRGTIDEDIHALGERKLELADKVSGEDSFDSDEAEQKKTAQSLLARLRDAAPADDQDVDNDDGDDDDVSKG